MFPLPSAVVLVLMAGPGAPGGPPAGSPFPDRVSEVRLGPGGGFGEDRLPDVVLGPPRGGGKLMASTHVLSLGAGGTITLEYVDREIVDGPGPDLIVFENPFLEGRGDDPRRGFFEYAQVEVSADGATWLAFPFDTASGEGCAGLRPVLAHAENAEIPAQDPARAGGDALDLKTIGANGIRFVRLTDLKSHAGDEGTTGFDLDAIAAIHLRPIIKRP